MKTWFANLEVREQKLVAGAAVFVVLAVLYMGAWQPIDTAQTRTVNGVEIWQRSVNTLRSLRGRLGLTDGAQASQRNINQPLVVVIDSTLRIRNMSAPQRSQPTGNNIRVEFENVSFDDVMLWLGDLSNQYALQGHSGSFTKTSGTAPGRVNAQLTIGR